MVMERGPHLSPRDLIASHRARWRRRKRYGLALRAVEAVVLGFLLAKLLVQVDWVTAGLMVLFFALQLAAAWLWSP